MAFILAKEFTRICKGVFKNEDVYIRYIKPYLAVPLYKQKTASVFELEEFQKNDENIQFAYFNRPNGDFKTKDEQQEPIRLPNAFSHWSYAVTGGRFMITDVQGWKIDAGKYVVTDPWVFTSE